MLGMKVVVFPVYKRSTHFGRVYVVEEGTGLVQIHLQHKVLHQTQLPDCLESVCMLSDQSWNLIWVLFQVTCSTSVSCVVEETAVREKCKVWDLLACRLNFNRENMYKKTAINVSETILIIGVSELPPPPTSTLRPWIFGRHNCSNRIQAVITRESWLNLLVHKRSCQDNAF